jgi:hemoglobin
MSTLFEKLGGEEAVSAVVDKFYEFMLADDSVRHFFATTDMSKQKCRQKQFITLVTGGPHNYQGADMKTAHCKHNIHKAHFDITWSHLQDALLHFSVPTELIE